MNWIEFGPAARRYVAPDFRLKASDGTTFTRSQFRHYHPLVLMFANDLAAPETMALLRNIESRSAEFAQVSAQIFMISPATDPVPPSRVPVLADPDNTTRRAYMDLWPNEERPSDDDFLVIILDRYGTPGVAGSGAPAGEALVDDMLAWVWGLELECPE